jgi:hypothetical protein
MAAHAQRFWSETERYHDLAREFEENVELVHPPYLTGRSGCGFCHHCPWAATSVTYYEYRGDSLK